MATLRAAAAVACFSPSLSLLSAAFDAPFRAVLIFIGKYGFLSPDADGTLPYFEAILKLNILYFYFSIASYFHIQPDSRHADYFRHCIDYQMIAATFIDTEHYRFSPV